MFGILTAKVDSVDLTPTQVIEMGKMVSLLTNAGLEIEDFGISKIAVGFEPEYGDGIIGLKTWSEAILVCTSNGTWETIGFPWKQNITPFGTKLNTDAMYRWIIINAKKNNLCYAVSCGTKCPIYVADDGSTIIKVGDKLFTYASSIFGRLRFEKK